MNKTTLFNQLNSARLKAVGFTLLCTLVLAAQPAMAAKHAAKVIYSFGDVKAMGKSGARELEKGDLVYSGETVATTRGRTQLKFTDGGFASLQPNTDYQIDEYKFEGKADGKERSFLSLLKGSVRLVTGVIGKANRRNFRIKTAVATIGIRGTQGTLSHNPVTNVTFLKGHGGEWDLESGNFSGGVPAGQAFSCDGVSCTQVAGVRQRSDVGRGQGKQQRRNYQQGQQSDPDGRICDLGGACDELAVKVDQVGAVAFTDDDGEVVSGATEFLEQLGVVTVGDKPVALVSAQTVDGEFGGGFVATDVEAIRTAVNGFSEEDPEFVAEATEFLDQLDSDILAKLEENPATVAEEDFQTTPDGLVTLGRWNDGNILFAVKGFGTGNVLQRLDMLENYESVHFAYGAELDDISFGGVGLYSLTGATYPTAVNGSSMGMMPTSGSLSWNFATATGSFALPVTFDGILFTIGGSLIAPDAQDLNDPTVSRIFTEDTAAAVFFSGGMPMSAPVYVDGFFTGENGTNAPLAAGLTYAVDYYSNPFVGAAAFGLAAQQNIMVDATIKYSLNYFDSTGMVPGSYSNGDDQFPMGTPLSNFTTTFGDSFNDTANIESGIDPTTQVHWARFASPYTFSSPFLVSGEMFTEDFHAIRADYTTPNSVIASTTGTATYTLAGGTSPTMVYDLGSLTFTQAVGTLTMATFSANFTTGTMTSVSVAGSFPSVATGSFTVASTGAVPINSGFSGMAGTFTDSGSVGTAGCMGGCALTGALNYGFTSASAGGPPAGIISSFNLNGPGFGIAGTAFSN